MLKRFSLISFLFPLLASYTLSHAQFVTELSTSEYQRLKEVQIYGLQGVTEDLVIRHLGLKPGDDVRPVLLSEKVGMAIRSLWESKLFSDVQVEIEYSEDGGEFTLIFKVEEQPTLSSVELVGQSALSESDLQALIQLVPGQVYGQGDVERLRQRILRKYHDEGYLLAEVQPIQTLNLDDGRTTLTFRIREGRKVTVAEIRINGNQKLKSDGIISSLASSVDHWWSSGEFKEEQLSADVDSIRAYYRTKGFLDAEVTGHRVIPRVDSTFHFFNGRLKSSAKAVDSLLQQLNRELAQGGALAEALSLVRHNDNPYFRRYRTERGAVPALRLENEDDLVDLLNRILDQSSLRQLWLKRIEDEGGRAEPVAIKKAKNRSNQERLLIRRDFEKRYGLLSFEEARTGHEVELEFDISEGRQYYAGDFTFSGNDVHPTALLRNRMRLEKDGVFDYSLYERSVQEIYGVYREEGYLFVQIEEIKTYRDSIVDVNFKITEGKPASIHTVIIEGNTTTKDKVIRREIHLFPGDTYRQSLMERSFRDIMQLNYFDNVVPDIRMRPESDQEVDLLFKVQEREAGTGQFTAGLAYSQRDYLTGTLGLSIPNCCLGDGQMANVALEYGEYRKNYSIGFSEPWFRDRPTRIGGTMSYYNYSYEDGNSPDIVRYGVRGYVGRRLKWPDDYFYVQGDVQFMRHEQGDNFSEDAVVRYTGYETSVSATIIRDDKDLPVFPTEGSRISLREQWAIPPGDFSFIETEVTAKWWWPLIGKLVLGFDGALGVINGEQLQYSTLYQMGGMLGYQGKLRGYSAGSIGRYRIGRSYLSLSAELSYGIVPQIFYIIGFANAGNVYGPHLDNDAIPTQAELPSPWAEIDLSDLYKDLGFGFRVQVPMLGIIGFDWGWPLDPSELSNGKRGTEVGEYRVNFIISQGF